jgi:hypothetical protein
MARIRSIKPEFWSSEQVMACSTNARLLFIGLWNFCDDAGRHPVTPRQIKALIFPADDISAENVRVLLDELSTNGLISFYTVDGKEYFQVTGWQHQKIDRPQSPKYPAPLADHSSNARDGEDEGRDKGEDGKGKERGGADAQSELAFVGKVIRLKSADFEKWRKNYPGVPDMVAELTKADDYYAENPPDGGKWFFHVSRWLAKAHEEASKATGTNGRIVLDKRGNRPGDPYYGVDY